MRRFTSLFLAALLIGMLAGCGQVLPGTGTTPQPKSTLTGTADPAAATKDIFADPGKFLGQAVTVEGLLEAEGQGKEARFFLSSQGARLEVLSWAPLEVMHPPSGEGPVPKTMPDYIGKDLRLTGTVEKGGDGFVLAVTQAEELP